MSQSALRRQPPWGGCARRVVVLSALVHLSLASILPAATFTVTTAADILNESDGLLSLREAVMAANATAEADVVQLPPGVYALTRSGGDEHQALTGDLDVRTGDLVIAGLEGASVTSINAGTLDRAFEVFDGRSLTLTGVTVRNGRAEEGGALYLHPGTQVNVGAAGQPAVLQQNAAVFEGGAIYNRGGTVTIAAGSVVSLNSADGNGGGIFNHADEAAVGSISIIEGAALLGNSAAGGGGAVNLGSMLIGAQSSVSGNTSSYDGAGIVNHGDLLVLEGVQISSNFSSDHGGALMNHGSVTMLGTASHPIVVADNFSSNSYGGVAVIGTGAMLSASHAVFENNFSADSGGALVSEGGTVAVAHCLFRNNGSGDSGGAMKNLPFEGELGEIFPAYMTLANSVFEINTGGDSGGGLLNESEVVMSGCAFIDNNGGAFENIGLATVSDTDFVGNTTGGDGGAIFNEGTLTIAGGTFAENTSGGSGGAVVNVDHGQLTLSGVTISGNTALSGGGVANEAASDFSAHISMDNCEILSNTGLEDGGGVLVEGGSVEFTGGTIQFNVAEEKSGGGAFVAGGGLTLVNARVLENAAGDEGGGIYNSSLGGLTVLNGGRINANTAAGGGGGIFNSDGDVTLNPHVRIRFNTAGAAGGGIRNEGNSVLRLEGATVGTLAWDDITANTPNNISNSGGDVDPGVPTPNMSGDLNCDDAVNGADINPFRMALLDAAVYAGTFADCDALNGDLDDDGAVGVSDIALFVEALLLED